MSTSQSHRLAAGLGALLLAGGGLLAGSTAASAAPFPADWQPISDADLATLNSWGIEVSYGGSRTLYLGMPNGGNDLEGFVVGGREFAVEEQYTTQLHAGDTVEVAYTGVMSARTGESVPVNAVAHHSTWIGGTNPDSSVFSTAITDYSLDAVPNSVLQAADLKGHNPATFSDCVENVCGISIAPARYYSNAGWSEGDSWEITQDSIFIPVTYTSVAGNGVEYTDWDSRDVSWKSEPGRVTGEYTGVVTLDDGNDYEASYTASITGSVRASAPWYEPVGYEGASTFNPCPADPTRTCLGIGQDAASRVRASDTLSSVVSYEIADEPIPGTPVDPETPGTPVDPTDPEVPTTPEIPGTPSVDDPTEPTAPVVDDPATPDDDPQQPAIPSRIESGAYGSAAHVVSRAIAGLATLAAAATIPVGVIRRRRGGTEVGVE